MTLRWRTLVLVLCCATVTLLAALLAHTPTIAQADDGSKHDTYQGPLAGTQTYEAAGTATIASTPTPTRWESAALSELADELGWPPIVSDDGARLAISLTVSSSDQALISIRPFDFSAGAQAAFGAEQEDARLGGLQVSSIEFNSYHAYSASRSNNGITYERRLHWIAGAWIFGIDISGTGYVMSALDPLALGDRLLQIALQHGLPPSLGGSTATPAPTYGQPSSATPTIANCGLAFTDVDQSYWAYRFIAQLACSGVIGGYPDGTFRPQNSTTRAQFAKMIVLSEGWSMANPSRPTFRDVDGSHLFYRYVETAFAHNVVGGYGGDLFKPDAYVTRAQVAKMLVRARGWSLSEQSTSSLCDVPASHWAWSYIQIAIEHNAFSGYANGCFYPDAFATRAQLAKVIVQAHP
jgi:hypothetical protein